MADKQALGARANLFAAHNSKQAHDVVTAVAAVSSPEQEGEETTVTAICPGAGSRQRWRGPLLLQPTPPEQPVPEQPAPEQPVPEQPAPEQPAPEQQAPEQPAPEQPAPDQFLPPVIGQPRRRT